MSLAERLYWLDAQIRDGRFPHADALADHFSVSRRTAFQTHAHLRDRLNAPVGFDPRRGGWFYTEPTFVLPFLALSEPEAAALRRSLLASQEYLDEPDAHAVRLLLERLAPYLSAPTAFESVGGSVHLAPEGEAPPGLLNDCRRALRSRHRLWLRYFGAHRGEESERVVRPHHLHNFQGEWHLLAWCEEQKDWRQFFLGRVRAWEVLEPEAAFVRDQEFDADAYLRQGLGLLHGRPTVRVRARFSPKQARWTRERRYHPSQQVEELSDGGLILTLEVAGTEEAKRWLLSYGAEVEVLEPPELREEITDELEKLAKIYARPRQ